MALDRAARRDIMAARAEWRAFDRLTRARLDPQVDPWRLAELDAAWRRLRDRAAEAKLAPEESDLDPWLALRGIPRVRR